MERKPPFGIRFSIKSQSSTAKSMRLKAKNVYTFIANPLLNKRELKLAFDRIFINLSLKINTLTMPPKFKRVKKVTGKKSTYKKLFVTLK